MALLLVILGFVAHVLGQGCPIPDEFDYHNSTTQTVRSFQGVFGSNFNETITFCDFKLKSFELNDWKIIPVLGQSADSGQARYNEKGAMLTGGTYRAPNGSVVWKAHEAYGYFTFLDQFNASTPAGETGPWLLYYEREPTREECALVYRQYKCGGR